MSQRLPSLGLRSQMGAGANQSWGWALEMEMEMEMELELELELGREWLGFTGRQTSRG